MKLFYVCIISYCLAFLHFGIAAADTDLTGKVVERRTGNGIRNVQVELRYSENGSAEGSDTTDDSGMYSIDASDGANHFFLTYKPSDTNEFSTNGRTWVSNDANPKTLDTVGLVRYRNRSSGDAAACAKGALNYVAAGGDSASAQRSLDAAARHFDRQVMKSEIEQIPWLRESLEEQGLRYQ